jgi:hypothetical protein
MGLGLPLSTFNSSSSTLDAEVEPRNDSVLSNLFTNTVLTAHLSYLISAAHFNWDYGVANFRLGLSSSLSSLLIYGYWEQVRLALRSALDTLSWHRTWHSLSHVLIYGENAHRETFNKMSKEEVRDAQGRDWEEMPVFLSKDAVYEAGTGATVLGAWCKGALKWGYSYFPDLMPRWQ